MLQNIMSFQDLTALFCYLGVEAESIASHVQSVFYGGATGGLFSKLQSAGARFGSR